MRQLPRSTDVLIIGAGPAGTVAGATLARAGHSVLAVEKQWFPRHVIGESLLPRCNELLHQAGLLEAVEGRRYMPKHAAMFFQGERTQRFAFRNSLPGDWTSSFQVPRDDFDQTLVTAARAQGVDVRYGLEVRDAAFREEGAAVDLLDVETGAVHRVEARFVLDCSGPARVLSRLLDLEVPADILARSAYYTHIEGDLRPEGEEAGDIWVVLHPNGAWVWIIPFSNGRTSVGVVAEQATFDAYPGGDGEKLWAILREEPNCAARLAKAEPVMRTQRLHGWSTITKKLHGNGWAVAGNAGDFLDPVFSSGVMFALESATLAGQLASRQLEGEAIDWDTAYDGHMQKAIGTFKTFVQAWYSGDLPRIFFSPVKPERDVMSICSILGGNVLNEENYLVKDGCRKGLDRMLMGLKLLEAGAKARAESAATKP
jgi:flavin-dependent dehydrogenase